MRTDEDAAPRERTTALVRWVSLLGGAVFLVFGLWAFVAPQAFFDNVATFEPYNAHLVRDLGAFQIGLGAVLVLAATLRDAQGGALLGVGLGAASHAVGHVLDRDLGGSPAIDIPTFTIVAIALLWAGSAQLRARR